MKALGLDGDAEGPRQDKAVPGTERTVCMNTLL